MNVSRQFNKYCLKTTLRERALVSKYWYDMGKYLPAFISKVKNAQMTLENKTLEFEILCRSMDALTDIKRELDSLGFSTFNNITSAYFAFMSLMLIYVVNKKPKSLEEVIIMVEALRSYIILYIVVDHTLDTDDTLAPLFKTSLSKILNGESVKKSHSKELNVSCHHLLRLLKLRPKSVKYLAMVAKAEFDSIDLQGGKHDTLQTCYDKGETSTIAGCAVLTDGEILVGCKIMGRLGQLYDDIADVNLDISENIATFATECLQKDGNVDRTVDKFCETFSKLTDDYESVKPILLHIFATFLVSNPNISEDLRYFLRDYSFLLCRGSDEFQESFLHTFQAYV
jgi:hypothetical protein